MNLQYMNLGITETDCTQSLRFWSNFDLKLPSEDGRNQKQQSGYPNKSKSRPYLLSTFSKDYNFFCSIWAFFGYKWVIRPGSKIKKSLLRFSTTFWKALYWIFWPFSDFALWLFQSHRQRMKESIGLPDAELHAKSFEKKLI